MPLTPIDKEVSLSGKLETITATEFRKQPGVVLQSVALGKTFVVTKSGKPIAVIAKPPGEELVLVIERDGAKSFAKA